MLIISYDLPIAPLIQLKRQYNIAADNFLIPDASGAFFQ